MFSTCDVSAKTGETGRLAQSESKAGKTCRTTLDPLMQAAPSRLERFRSELGEQRQLREACRESRANKELVVSATADCKAVEKEKSYVELGGSRQHQVLPSNSKKLHLFTEG